MPAPMAAAPASELPLRIFLFVELNDREISLSVIPNFLKISGAYLFRTWNGDLLDWLNLTGSPLIDPLSAGS